MGSGDWNDGMNLVGAEGKGESVWLAFFLYHVLEQFGPIAKMRGDESFVLQYTEEAEKLKNNIDVHAWDGEWYRRAYFDDGTPLGSAQNQDCQIDAIAQSWSVLSGAGSFEKTKQAMISLERRLIHSENSLIRLLDPPFDKSNMEPGYIKGYVPGVRENGGQYTHAAVWTVMAFAMKGDTGKAKELLDMINPVNHGSTREKIEIYKVEPYVMAADIYGASPHVGRGGWTWYTGAASWMYRLIIESVIGLDLQVNKLHFKPCLPENWERFKVHYRYRETVYHLAFEQLQPGKEICVTVDGVEQPDRAVTLVDDRVVHFVAVKIGNNLTERE
jgi:cellobiose phosphorylase